MKRKALTPEQKARANKKRQATLKRPIRTCWLCFKQKRKYMHEHHVFLRENDLETTLWLCAGCHYLIGLLARRKFLNNAQTLEDLITLARFQAGLEDAKTIIKFEYTGGKK